MAKNILQMTGTITPMAEAGGAVTRRADPAVRRADYENALRFYLSLPNGVLDGILFCENSGSDLSSFEEIATRENPNGIPVEFASTVSDCPPEYGKGHSEMLIMDRAYESHVKQADPETRFWKVTGRLVFPNIARIIARAPKAFDVYIDMRLVPSFLSFFGTDRWADTRLFAYTPRGYEEQFLGRRSLVGTPERKHLKNSHVVELMFFDHLYEASKTNPRIVPRMRTQPVIIGVGAVSLKNYNDTASKAKNLVRSLSRRLVPSLWL